jgi:hypothetical protein
MNKYKNWAIWTFHHIWIILGVYLISILFVLLPIHGSFGFTMDDDGTYLSNALMHMGSGAVLALGTGILQAILLKKHIHSTFLWVLALIGGFLLTELIAGIILWKLEIYRGLINIFNSQNHLPEASIFVFAGLVAGIFQFRLFHSSNNRRYYWIPTSAIGWGILILSTYLGLFGFIVGAMCYGVVTGFVVYLVIAEKNTLEIDNSQP